jgi:hypothetical protein
MTSKRAIVLTVLAEACLLAACTRPAEKPATPELPPAAAAPAPEAPAPAGVTKATVTSTHGAWPAADAPDFSALKAVAFRDSSIGNASVVVVLTNYDFPAEPRPRFSNLPPLEKGQGRIEVWLTRQKAVQPGETLAFDAGAYDPTKAQGQAERTGDIRIAVAGGTSLQFSSPSGTIEVTSVTADAISGTFDVRDKWTHLSGEFHAPLK